MKIRGLLLVVGGVAIGALPAFAFAPTDYEIPVPNQSKSNAADTPVADPLPVNHFKAAPKPVTAAPKPVTAVPKPAKNP